jgi:ribosomal-protein-alanine N-acetyltransferase
VSLPITTARLIIRPFTPADFEAIHAVWSDPAVMAPIPSHAYDREQSWARLRRKLRHQARHGFSKWAVAEQASGTVIGECGVHYLEDGPDIELGYKLARAFWGQGLTAEAARACLDWPGPNGPNGSWPSSTPPTSGQRESSAESAWPKTAPSPASITRGTST